MPAVQLDLPPLLLSWTSLSRFLPVTTTTTTTTMMTKQLAVAAVAAAVAAAMSDASMELTGTVCRPSFFGSTVSSSTF